ncbi:MAG: ABC transporter permease [Clostridia bacterium]|nr:ABC transporter permease [Clostridia bacterium]
MDSAKFKGKAVLYGLVRHKRRNIVSCLLLAAVLSVAFCGFFYRSFALKEQREIAARYANRYRIAFRNELQYSPEHPGWSALDARLNGTSATDGVPDIYFDPDVMSAYHHPYPATAELFDALGSLPECRETAVAYAETAYGFSEDLPADIQDSLRGLYSRMGVGVHDVPTKIVTEHIVVGGDLGAFTGIARETSSQRLFDFILTEGVEPRHGECVITDFYARIYGKGVGDSLTLCDVAGNPIAELKISGIYSLYRSDRFEFVNPDVPRSGRHLTGADFFEDFGGRPDVGTPFDRLCEDLDAQEYIRTHYRDMYYYISEAMLGVIHTDFETAYTLYGTPETDADFAARHHINNFFAYFDLKDDASPEAFEEAVRSMLPEEWRAEFTVYPFANSYENFIRNPNFLLETADAMIRVSGALTAILFLIVTIVLIRENGREIGTYLSLGIPERDIVMKTAGENTILVTIALLAAAVCGGPVHWLLSKGYIYLEMNALRYGPTAVGLVFAVCAAAGCFIVTALLTAGYIHINSPIRLIRRDEA